MGKEGVTHVRKACAYITRDTSELLVFRGPGHDGLQIPKGTVEPGETPRDALFREAIEESGLATFERPRHLVTDVWKRRDSPPKRYVRSFYHVPVYESRDAWTHTVTGSGEEQGVEFEFSWLTLPTDATFALDLDDYVHVLPHGSGGTAPVDTTTD
ncbi:NUDIX hydrolase [Halorientalis marina]|jgi:8-oxo-dGTP pyrophosphatase MutT (NUDIX family)|uniref:NUDIX hydrolase n=1 Tax=Halorientalis marina TaxID=2931976 RepID=UPI001FF36E31|nr:NUDIX domain-containing protein [Halorientalis marina]